MLTDIDGILVGHWTQGEARTGCTVVVLPPGCVASGEVRGGAPATREFALLDPIRTVGQVDAVVLSGGSAFGLAAADGVMGWLEGQGRGFETSAGPVPIVVGMSLFDLAVGDGSVRPGPEEGLAAARAATTGVHEVGLVGAGTGATVGKWLGRDEASPGGIGAATLAGCRCGRRGDGERPGCGERRGHDRRWHLHRRSRATPGPQGEGLGGREQTTIGVVATNAALDKIGCHLVAQSAHDGLARGLLPAHTAGDGDAMVVAATGAVEADLTHVRVLAQQVVTAAVRSLA